MTPEEQAEMLAEALEALAPELRIMAKWAHGPTSEAYWALYEQAQTALTTYNAERLK